jgi:hypothetical protein
MPKISKQNEQNEGVLSQSTNIQALVRQAINDKSDQIIIDNDIGKIVIDDNWGSKEIKNIVFNKYYNHSVIITNISKYDSLPVNILFLNGVKYLEIERNTGLKTLSKIKVRGIIDRLYLIKNDYLMDLPDLYEVTSIDQVGIWDNQEIRTLDGLMNVKQIARVHIVRNKQLRNIRGLRNAQILEEVAISENPKLVSLDGLQGASEKLYMLHISRNPMLRDLKPLSHIKEADEVGFERLNFVLPKWARKLYENRCRTCSP